MQLLCLYDLDNYPFRKVRGANETCGILLVEEPNHLFSLLGLFPSLILQFISCHLNIYFYFDKEGAARVPFCGDICIFHVLPVD